MTKVFKEAQKLSNELEEQIRIVDSELNYPRILKLAIYTADKMKSVTPMYTRNLNPKWKELDVTITILKGRLNGK